MTKSQNTKNDLRITVEKQVWESTLNRSMVLQAENEKLKELLKRVVNATDFYHEIKTASVVDHGVWYNIANEIIKVLGEE